MLGSVAGVVDYGAFVDAVSVFPQMPEPGGLGLTITRSNAGMAGGPAVSSGVLSGARLWLSAVVTAPSIFMATYRSIFRSGQWSDTASLAGLGNQRLAAQPGDVRILQIKSCHGLCQALFVAPLKPKAIVFHLIAPLLFIDLATHQVPRIFGTMAAPVAVLTLLYGLIAVFTAHHPARWVRSKPKVSGLRNQPADVLRIGFGLQPATSK